MLLPEGIANQCPSQGKRMQRWGTDINDLLIDETKRQIAVPAEERICPRRNSRGRDGNSLGDGPRPVNLTRLIARFRSIIPLTCGHQIALMCYKCSVAQRYKSRS